MSSLILMAILLAPTAAPPPAAGAPSAAAPSAAAPAVVPGSDARPAGSADRDYRVGPGDILRIAVYGHDDLTQTVVVQPSGTIVLPLLGPVVAAESTPAELEARITAQLAKGYIRDAKVTAIVQEYRSKVIYVMGEVARPGTYPLAGQTRVVEILSRAGPLTANAGHEVLVVRGGSGSAEAVASKMPASAPGAASGTPGGEIVRVDLRAMQAGQLDQNMVLQPNDTIIVPQAARFFVSGEVRNPGAFAHSHGLTIRQAVSLAGGFTADAATRTAKVVRQVNGRTKTQKLKLDEPVQAGDTIVIGTRLF